MKTIHINELKEQYDEIIFDIPDTAPDVEEMKEMEHNGQQGVMARITLKRTGKTSPLGMEIETIKKMVVNTYMAYIAEDFRGFTKEALGSTAEVTEIYNAPSAGKV